MTPNISANVKKKKEKTPTNQEKKKKKPLKNPARRRKKINQKIECFNSPFPYYLYCIIYKNKKKSPHYLLNFTCQIIKQ